MGANDDPQPPGAKPRALDEREEAAPPSSTFSPAPSVRGTSSATVPAPVLIIDDSEIARETMTRILRDAGWPVVALPSPIGATQAIVRHRARVVVLDVMMPTIRGDRLLTLFRSNPRLSHISVILVSGHAEHDLERLQRDSNADAVISKRNLDRLPALVKRLASKER